MRNYPRGVAGVAQHRDWLSLVRPEGPFLSVPVLNQAFPNGVDRPEAKSPRIQSLMDEHKNWRRKPVENHENWIRKVLFDGAQWPSEYVALKDEVPNTFEHSFPEHGTSLRPWAVLFDSPNRDTAKPIGLVTSVPIGQDLRAIPEDGWAASPIDRMARLLRRSKIQIGVVTDGRWWALVWADASTSTASAVFDSRVWNEEPLMRDAFFSLIGIKLQVGVGETERLPSLFHQSLLQQEEITDALGRQVRQAVELLVQSFSESRIAALSAGRPDPLPDDEQEPYEAAVTVMMRIVFMLFAEERGLLPVDRELYGHSYGISGLLNDLEDSDRLDPTALDRSTAVWHRILATSTALFSGATFEDMRMPAYGGSLFDPKRFPWLYHTDEEHGLTLAVHDRVLLHVLRSIQIVRQNGQARRISFREVDVEQIGYVYEGLLGYASQRVDSEAVLGLQGTEGDEPEIPLEKLLDLRKDIKNDEKFVDALIKLIEVEQPAAKPQTKPKMLNALNGDFDEAIARQQLGAVTAHDKRLVKDILPFVNLLRRDLRGLPYVVPKNGIVVTETSSRKNAGAHYTPRSLAEEVVLHALEPLVYLPGPLQEEDSSKWVLKSSVEILNLKVADIAVGSGAFLVAAARYLAARLVEAWRSEGASIGSHHEYDPDRPYDPMMTKALREVVARCLYGADINEMAVEMCKLSLWLISLDPARPFSFLDDKVMLGNSLLGLTSIEQLRKRHIFPDSRPAALADGLFDDVYSPIETAVRLRKEIASSPVDDSDVHRSAAHKANLLRQANEATEHLREIADGVIAAGLPLGGKPGPKLEEAYGTLEYAVNEAQAGNRAVLDRILEDGLTPTVSTDYKRWKPLHWILEAPQVMDEWGFDAIIGNPPFMASSKISGSMGTNMREWFANVVSKSPGRGDFVVYFFLRSAELLNANGVLGLVGAKAVAEGDSLQLGIGPLIREGGFSAFRVNRNRPWPTSKVGTEIATVWMTRQSVEVPVFLDELEVPQITDILVSSEENMEWPIPIDSERYASKGSDFLGHGFLLQQSVAKEIINSAPNETLVLKPFLNGKELSTSPERVGSQWIIDFRVMSEQNAKKFKKSWAIVETQVKPERLKKKTATTSRLAEFWWQHSSPRIELYERLSDFSEVVVLARTSKHVVPALVSANQVFGDALIVFPNDSFSFYALLSSWFHRSWAIKWSTRMGSDRIRYSISVVFNTFPFPETNSVTAKLGQELHELQCAIARDYGIGLTKIYNSINSSSTSEIWVKNLREIHQRIDSHVNDLYGFRLEIGEYELAEFEKSMQWGPPASQRIEILQLLLAENKRQQVEGVIEWPTK